MTATSLLKCVNNKKFLFFAVVVFFLPFVLFCFWNVPAADDYMIFSKSHQYTFWGLQASIYRTWSGRYFSTFLSSIFSYSGFLYSHYYVHTILLLSSTVLSWIFLLKQVNKYFLSNLISLKSIILVSLLLLVLEINIIPEPVTAFYWFSSSITYQVPLILLILLAGVLIKLLIHRPYKKGYLALATLLIVLLHGCNEIITMFVLIISTCVMIWYYSIYKSLPRVLIGLYLFSVINSSFLLFAPGIINRSALISTSPFLLITGLAFIKFIILNWFFLKEPLWWLCVFFLSCFISENLQLRKLFINQSRLSFPLILLLYLATGLFIYVPVLYVTNGSLPLRTENTLCFLYSLISLLGISIFLTKSIHTTVRFVSPFYKYKYLLITVLIFSSYNMKKVSDSLLSGFFYNQVMRNRLQILEDAKRRQQIEVNFDDYQTAVNAQIVKHPFANRQMLRQIILRPPPIICFQENFYDLSYVKELYGIKKLTVNKK